VHSDKGRICQVKAGANIAAGAEVMVGTLGQAIPLATNVAAALATGVVASNNAITWTSFKAGTAGNAYTIALVDPAGNNVALSVDVDGKDIIVTLATGVAGAITSTPATIIAAILEHDTASQLVLPTNTGASSGAAAVTAVAKTNLAGGVDDTAGEAAGKCVDGVSSGNLAWIRIY
jgi:hypothetical protein